MKCTNPNCGHEIPDDSKFCPDCGNRVCRFTIDTLFPINGLTLGVSTLSDARNLGYEVDEYFVRDSGFSADEHTENPDVLSFFMIEADRDEWPSCWNEIGLKRNLSFDELFELCKKMGMDFCHVVDRPEFMYYDQREGYHLEFTAFTCDKTFEITFHFCSDKEENAKSIPNSLTSVTIGTEEVGIEN